MIINNDKKFVFVAIATGDSIGINIWEGFDDIDITSWI